jgi:hypothetical protein
MHSLSRVELSLDIRVHKNAFAYQKFEKRNMKKRKFVNHVIAINLIIMPL